MNQNITCKTVQELEEFLREHYHAEQIEPVEYLLYNARQPGAQSVLSGTDAADF